MSKIRNLPEETTLDPNDLLYVVDSTVGANGGKKLKVSTLRTNNLPTAAEVKSLYESNPDTNDFTDAEKTKLAGIETGATADQIASEVPYDNSVTSLSATNVQDAIDQVSEEAGADFKPSIVSGRILHYTGGTARFDDIFYAVAAGDILLNPNITNGTVYIDLDGIVKQTASSTSPPPYTIVFAFFSTDLNNITGLIDYRVKNQQNIVRGLDADVRDVRAGASKTAGSSGRISDAQHKHDILTAAASTQLADQVNAEGVAIELARADHTHEIPTDSPIQINADGNNDQGIADTFSKSDHKHDILTDVPVTQNPDQTNTEGTSDAVARADHIHNIPTSAPVTNLNPNSSNSEGSGTDFSRNDHSHAFDMNQAGDLSTINAGDAESLGTAARFSRADHQHPVATAAASLLSANSTNTEGVSTSLARADHTHDLSTGTPSTQTPDQANAEGSSDNLARADHVHNIPADAPTTTLSPATSNSEGVGTSFARNDHTHAVGTGLVGDITTIQPDDSAAAGIVDRFARADHKHAIVAATPSTQNPDQANAEGSSTSFARADHIHNIPADAPTTTLTPATSNAEGSGTSFARNDHTHAIATALTANISTIQPDDVAAAGTSDTFARGDHKHAIGAATASSLTTSSTNTEGSSTSFARADHTHAVSIDNSSATATADDTTTSATDTLMNSMTLTPAAGVYLALWSGSIVNSANGAERTFISLYVGGSQVTATERSIGTSGGAYASSSVSSIVTVNGSQAVELRWRVAGGTSTVHSRRLTVLKVSN